MLRLNFFLRFSVFCSLALLQLFLSQTTAASDKCTDLGFPGNSYLPGTSLGVCRNKSKQCCNQSYIDDVMERTSGKLQEGISLQLMPTVETVSRTVEGVMNYFTTGPFHEEWLNSGKIPNPFNLFNRDQLDEVYSFRDLLENPFENLTNNLSISQFVDEVINSVSDSAGHKLGVENVTRVDCVREHIRQNVNSTDKQLLIGRLQLIRNCLTTLKRSADFLSDLANNSTNFMFPSNCTEEFVKLNYCPRCTRAIAPVCSNTCAALVQGCFAPYYTVLSCDLDVLFNVSSQLITIQNDTLTALFSEDRHLWDVQQLEQLLAKCDVQNPGMNVVASSTTQNQIPREIITELERLMGRGFTYDNGTLICKPDVDEQMFCRNAPNLREMNGCSVTEACTSDCHCFNGSGEQAMNTQEFTGYGILDQCNNPAISLTKSKLSETATSIGTPISDFFRRQDIISTLPSDMIVPPKPELLPDPADKCGGGGDIRNRALATAHAVTTFLLAWTLFFSWTSHSLL